MYKITHFDKQLCHLFRHHWDFIDDSNICEIYSIWNFSPSTAWKSFKNFFTGKYLCKAQNFSIIYWLVLTISVMGIVRAQICSLCELATALFCNGRRQLKMWRHRRFYVLPFTLLRKCRLVAAVISLNAWLLLCYAVMTVSPTHMTLWLTINVFILSLELITWIVEVLSGACKFELYTLFLLGVALARYMFVCCVQSVFVKAIEMNDEEKLRLWKSFEHTTTASFK